MSIGTTALRREIEAKYRLAYPAALRRRLHDYAGPPQTHQLEANRIFDTPARTLHAAGCGLRLRTCRPLDGDEPPTTTLTYKGPRAPGALKVREEIETAVGAAEPVVAILQRLGFQEVVVYEKRRETWQLGECAVCLDELPKLGWFVEIEGPSAKSIDAIIVQLGLSGQTPLPDTYVELAAQHGTPDAAGVCRLVF